MGANRILRVLSVLLPVAGLAGGCEGPNIEGLRFSCDTTADCGAGFVCERSRGECAPAFDNTNGVFDDKLVLGMSAAITVGRSSLGAVGSQALNGFEAYFDKVNQQGGVFERRIEVIATEDEYNASITRQNVKDFLDGPSRRVFALVGVLGTPNSLVAREAATENKVILFAPGSGADELEPDPPDRYVFNVRARYSEEAAQLTQYAISKLLVPKANVAVFAQGTSDQGGREALDPFGASGRRGVAQALAPEIADQDLLTTSYDGSITLPPTTKAIADVLRWMAATGERGRAEVQGQVSAAVVVVALPTGAGSFICGVEAEIAKIKANAAPSTTLTEQEKEQLKKVVPRFLALSPVGLALKAIFELTACGKLDGTGTYYSAGTVIATTVPDPSSNATGVIEFRADQTAHLQRKDPGVTQDEVAAATSSPIALEGYLSAKLLVEGLRKHGRDLTTESFIDTLETLSVDVGIGSPFAYSSVSHQATDRLYAVEIQSDLGFKPLGLLANQ